MRFTNELALNNYMSVPLMRLMIGNYDKATLMEYFEDNEENIDTFVKNSCEYFSQGSAYFELKVN